MNRRTALKSTSMAVLGFAFGACSSKSPKAPVDLGGARVRPALGLVPVHASWERVIHTTVGLRPYRESGFVVKAEKLDRKTLIHNYGHGGAGISLSWGTSFLAADIALSQHSRRAAVIGCGAAGLTTARQLQRRGFDVTIYAKTVPPHTTSNMSLATWSPTSRVVAVNRRNSKWDEQFRFAAETGYRELQLLAGRDYGISWIDSYGLLDERPPERRENPRALLPAHLRMGREVLGPGLHPFPTRFAARERYMRIEPAIYLDRLVEDVHRFGGRVVIRSFDSRRDLAAVSEDVIVNCTGLGSRDLLGDDELTPYKGQLTLLAPQPEVSYATNGGFDPDDESDAMPLHMSPRSDGIALGGTAERGEWSLEPNEEARQRVVDGHIELFARMRAPWSS